MADAERALLTKTTKALTESKRIASDKIDDARAKLADLQRTELRDDDSRIFPDHYAPVMVMEGGVRVVKPMRYRCRPAGKPAFYDEKCPGTYSARRNNLEGFWKGQFGYTHGLTVATAFYENVNRHRAEGRELGVNEEVSNVRLEFKPDPQQDMLVACLWSRWTAPGEPDLLSFAAITDDPPPEVAAAGGDIKIIGDCSPPSCKWLTGACTTPRTERLTASPDICCAPSLAPDQRVRRGSLLLRSSAPALALPRVAGLSAARFAGLTRPLAAATTTVSYSAA